MTDRIGTITKNKEQKVKTCEKISVLQKRQYLISFFAKKTLFVMLYKSAAFLTIILISPLDKAL